MMIRYQGITETKHSTPDEVDKAKTRPKPGFRVKWYPV